MPEPFGTDELKAIDAAARRIGREVFDRLEAPLALPWQRQWWDEMMMNWAMTDETVKVQMFRFVDVLPTLKSSDAVVRHMHEYFHDVLDRLPAPARIGLPLAKPGTLAGQALARAARLGAKNQARKFIAGSKISEVVEAARRQREQGRAFTLDILGEAVTSEPEARRYFDAYLELIHGVSEVVNRWPEVRQIDCDDRGRLPRTNISVKLSSLDSQADPIDWSGSIERISARLRELFRAAREQQVFINIDMESYGTKDLTLAVFKQVLEEEEFRHFPDAGIVIQCYLKDAERDLIDLRDWAAKRGTHVWVRIVKGAYWDYETIHARYEGWPVPVFQEKWESDANFERQSRFLMQNSDLLRPAIASHNVRSLAYAMAVAEHLGMPQESFELQMLYGMADAEKQALVEMGYRLRVYMPFGELIPGMAYLVRRLLENTSNDSFLRASFTEHIDPDVLLADPASRAVTQQQMQKESPTEPKGEPVSAPYWKQHEPEPHTDFSVEEHRREMEFELDEVKSRLGQSYPLVIGGERIETLERLESRDPSQHNRIVGTVAMADAEHAGRAVSAAKEALPEWSAMGARRRAKYVRGAAEAMRRRRYELAAWEVYECAKGWREADADVCEAIDFCEFYAAGAVAMDEPSGKDAAGEQNEFAYLPRGVTAVIAPWNFPLAILTGMTAAALATGNTVIMKPAEQSPVIAAILMEIFDELDLPPGVLNYLPGAGEVAGAALVEHPEVALIAFTGSREVGLAINAKAAEVSRQGAPFVKRAIAEMGGKNAIIVDDDADLDEAVLGVVQSAFGYQGQKCSACSRAIVVGSAYETFLARLVEATRSLKIGPAEDPAARVGPVIDREAFAKIHKYIDIGRSEAREALSVDVEDWAERGYFVGPHIFADVDPQARIAQEEIFGPVLAVIRAKDLDEALQMANGTPYALTGGIYSRSPANLERARCEFQVGNLYLNRTCTGAIVGRQPFGGFKMSGIGSKAGGPDYLLQFVVPKTITENTMRRGFAPPSE